MSYEYETGLTDLLESLAVQGMSALGEDTGESEELDQMFLLASIYGSTDLRDERITLLFISADTDKVAAALRATLEAWPRALQEQREAEEELVASRNRLTLYANSTRGMIRRLNGELDKEEYLCGRGIHAATGLPSVTRLADDLIYERAMLSKTMTAFRAARSRYEEARLRVEALRSRVAIISVGDPSAVVFS